MSTSRPDFDIVVVGGGIVGPCFAALAARDPHVGELRVALVEPATPTPPRSGEVDLRVSALSRASQRILDAVQAWQPIEPQACAYSEMVVWDAASRADAPDALRFSAAETGEPDLGHIVENLRMQWALSESPLLRRMTRLHTALAELDHGEDATRLTLADGRRLRAALVVGADGGASPTRELSGIERDGRPYSQAAVVAHLTTERPHADTAWQRFLHKWPDRASPLAGRSCLDRVDDDTRRSRVARRASRGGVFRARHRGQRRGARRAHARERAGTVSARALARTRVLPAEDRARG